MIETSKSSKEAQNKVVQFLKKEFARLKFTYQEELKTKTSKQKNIEKKLQKLYQKIEAVTTISSLDIETKAALLSLQYEIKYTLDK
jgi:hypothetical protein